MYSERLPLSLNESKENESSVPRTPLETFRERVTVRWKGLSWSCVFGADRVGPDCWIGYWGMNVAELEIVKDLIV